MKLLVLSVCLLATIMITRALNLEDLATHGEEPSKVSTQKQECYDETHLTSDELISQEEMKNNTYKQDTERARKNGCFAACILQKRELIVDGVIQKEKLYAKEAHANLRPDVRAAIYRAVNRCVKEVETNPDLCDKSLELLVCSWKSFH